MLRGSQSQLTLHSNNIDQRIHQKNAKPEEACGIPLPGVFAAEPADIEFVREKTEKPSTKPACDGAICAIVSCGFGIKPLILYEYKPTVDPQ